MEGHTSYINHLVFEPAEGKQIASVSDDHTCRLVVLQSECEKVKYMCVCVNAFCSLLMMQKVLTKFPH